VKHYVRRGGRERERYIWISTFEVASFQLLIQHVHNNLLVDCTVGFIEIGSLKNLPFGGGTSPCGASTHFHFCTCVLYLKMVELNHRNMLWLKQPNERAVFRRRVCVSLNRYWNTCWNYCGTEFVFVHSEILSDLCSIRCDQSAHFPVSVTRYITVPNRDLKLMSSTHCQSTVFLVCCPTDMCYTKLQENNTKPCAWFRLFQANIYTQVSLNTF
jgi:hypothetical protein